MGAMVPTLETNEFAASPAINKLPREILLNIFDRLLEEKWDTLKDVCRLWYDILIPGFYHTIRIIDDRQLSLLRRTVTDPAASKPLGEYVRCLVVEEGLDKEQVALLRDLFPHVTELQGELGGYNDLLSDLPNWTHIENIWYKTKQGNVPAGFPIECMGFRLTTLEVQTVDYSEWMNTLLQLSGITSLTLGMEDEDLENEGTVSLSVFDKVINRFPHLEELSLRNLRFNGELPEQILSCNSLKYLRLQGVYGDRMGQLFARKFYNIKSLDLYYYELCSNQTALIQSCRKLEDLYVYEPDCYQPCMEILRKIGAPIHTISYFIKDMFWLCKAIHSFQDTLLSVTLDGSERISIPKMLIDELEACRSLRNLDLRRFAGHVDIDEILDCCRHLSELYIQCDSIGIHNNYHVSTRKTLTSIYMRADNTIDEVFVYLLRACPNLSSLSCSFSAKANENRTICYPSRRLSTIRIYTHNDSLIKLTQLSEEERIKYKDWDGKQVERSIDEKDGCTKWFQLLCKGSNYPTVYPIEPAKVANVLQNNTYNAQGSEGYNKCQQSIQKLPIVSIICPYMEDTFIYYHKVCN